MFFFCIHHRLIWKISLTEILQKYQFYCPVDPINPYWWEGKFRPFPVNSGYFYAFSRLLEPVLNAEPDNSHLSYFWCCHTDFEKSNNFSFARNCFSNFRIRVMFSKNWLFQIFQHFRRKELGCKLKCRSAIFYTNQIFVYEVLRFFTLFITSKKDSKNHMINW